MGIKHTPGPWLVVIEDEDGDRWTEDAMPDVWVTRLKEGDSVIGIGMGTYLENPGRYCTPHFWESDFQISAGEKSFQEHLANALLMRAAPELLRAAVVAQSWLEGAIEDGTHADRARADLEIIRAAIAKATGGGR